MEDKRNDDFLEDDASDDASIEILSESADSHTRDSEWSIYSRSGSSIARSEASLMDFQKLSIHSKMATIVHHDGQQFIERRDLDDGGLPYSAEFQLNGEMWKLSGEDCFLMSSRRYMAMVTMEDTVDLDGADGFEEAVQTLLKHLKVEKVCLDKDLEECNKTKHVLQKSLDKLIDESGENIDCKRDVILLRMLLKKHGHSLNVDFKLDLRNCSRISSEIMPALDNYVIKALKLIQRNKILGHLNDSTLWFINASIQEAFNRHRARLAAICPSSMKDKLNELPDDFIMYITMDDMHLFSDLTTLDEGMLEAALPMIFSKLITSVQQINDDQYAYPDPLVNRIFLYVCKSLQEIAEQFVTHTEINNAIIYSETLGWEVTNLQEESQTPHSKSLRKQLQMLAKLANHFEPGGPLRRNPFPYEFKLFQNMDAIPEPVRIWLCLLDDCMKDLMQADLDKMQMLSCFFKSYVSFIASEGVRSETLECLRTITHDALRSLADLATSQHDRSALDSVPLKYNQMISCCVNKFQCEPFLKECGQIETMLQKIICKAFEMNASLNEWSRFSNEFKRLLNDLNELQLDWFIQLTPSDKRRLLLRSQFIVPVDSIWKDTEYECFKVVDLEGFVEMYKHLYNSEEVPKHYQLEVIQVLLQKLEKLPVKQSWTSGKDLPDRLAALIVMINSIRSSLKLLKEQPDYRRFEDFLLTMSKSCIQAIKENLKEVPHKAVDSGEELDRLIDRFEGNISKVLLVNSLKIFTTRFNKHITETHQLSREKRIQKIVSNVQSKLEPKLATAWTEEFKRNELPEVLAGVSAVWSIIVSESGNSLEKMTKPSPLQISCVLNIFGDQENRNKDYPHQLLQLPTQQEKVFVLGLTAALLTLYGHRVQIICFNSQLTRMNTLDWIEVFKSFSIRSNIIYESLTNMAWKRSRGVCEKYKAYINECFGLETNANDDKDTENPSEEERSVLLIEDIEIILREDILSMPFRQFVRPTIPGLHEVQRKLFNKNEPLHGNEIDQYIKRSDDSNIVKLRAFLSRRNTYTLLEGNPFEEVKYTNQTLFQKHLRAMKEAKTVKEYCLRFQKTLSDSYYYGYLPLGDIPFPYRHLLKSFPLVLGFTSSPLNMSDIYFLISHYDIYRAIPETMIFQTIPTKFDPKKNFLYVDSMDDRDWIEAIIVAIKAAVDRNCLVLVFSSGTQEMKQLNVEAIETALNKENLSVDDFSSEDISVLMICNGPFSKDRQVHVIQTFFSDDPKEEDLIRSQAVRSHSSGSYELIIPTIRNMVRYVCVNTTEEEITYDWLVERRRYCTDEEIKLCAAMSSSQYNRIKKFLKL